MSNERSSQRKSSTKGSVLAEVVGKRYWNEGDARRVVDEWVASGLSASDFARQQGLGRGRLEWWRKRLQDARGSTDGGGPQWLAVQVVDSAVGADSRPAADDTVMEVVLVGGRRICVRPGFDPAAIRRLVATLEVASC